MVSGRHVCTEKGVSPPSIQTQALYRMLRLKFILQDAGSPRTLFREYDHAKRSGRHSSFSSIRREFRKGSALRNILKPPAAKCCMKRRCRT